MNVWYQSHSSFPHDAGSRVSDIYQAHRKARYQKSFHEHISANTGHQLSDRLASSGTRKNLWVAEQFSVNGYNWTKFEIQVQEFPLLQKQREKHGNSMYRLQGKLLSFLLLDTESSYPSMSLTIS